MDLNVSTSACTCVSCDGKAGLYVPGVRQVVQERPQRHAGGCCHRPCCDVQLHGEACRRCGLVARRILDPARSHGRDQWSGQRPSRIALQLQDGVTLAFSTSWQSLTHSSARHHEGAHSARVSCSSVVTMLMLWAVAPAQNWSGFQLHTSAWLRSGITQAALGSDI